MLSGSVNLANHNELNVKEGQTVDGNLHAERIQTDAANGNLQPTCQHFNRQKGVKTTEEYLRWLQGRKKSDDGY